MGAPLRSPRLRLLQAPQAALPPPGSGSRPEQRGVSPAPVGAAPREGSPPRGGAREGGAGEGRVREGGGRGGLAALCLAGALALAGPLAAQQVGPPAQPSDIGQPQGQPDRDGTAPDLAQSDLPGTSGPTDLPSSDLPTADLPSPDLPSSDLPTADLPSPDLPVPQVPAPGGAAGGLGEFSSGTIPLSDPQEVSSPILTMDQDVLYLSSAWGLRAQARLEAEGDIVSAENDRLTQLLSREEAALTEQRATLPAAEFRRMAESFDLRATRIRRERAQAVQDLNAWAEADRAAFFRAALPVMGRIMQERGAVAVLDRRTVFVSLEAIDVTQQLVAALDRRIGDGEGAVPLPDPPPPAPEDAPVAE